MNDNIVIVPKNGEELLQACERKGFDCMQQYCSQFNFNFSGETIKVKYYHNNGFIVTQLAGSKDILKREDLHKLANPIGLALLEFIGDEYERNVS